MPRGHAVNLSRRNVTFKSPTPKQLYNYSEVPIIRPPMVLVVSGLNGEQVSLLMRPIYIENCNLVLKLVV